MFDCRVTLVAVPIVFRVLAGYLLHVIVAVSFGQDRSGSDAKVFGVALYDAVVRRIFIFIEPVAVDDQKFRAQGKLFYRPVHSQERSIEDIDLIDLFI